MSQTPVHPGRVLAEQLDELGVTPTELARQIDVPPNRISQIIHGKRSISGDTALRFAHWFGTAPEQWLSFQVAYDVRMAERSSGRAIRRLPTRAQSAQRRFSTRTKAAT